MQSHEAAGRADEVSAPARMVPGTGRISRRSVLRSAAGAGAAGFALTALAGPGLAEPALAQTRRAAGTAEPAAAADESFVVHVRDLRRGEIDIYRGTSHFQVTDRELAARLAQAGH
jgi:hypothetical protein